MKSKMDVGYYMTKKHISMNQVVEEPAIYRKTIESNRARLAIVLIERHGLVSGVEVKEDSAGRAYLCLPSPSELVNRACDISNTLFDEIEKRGWMLKPPEPVIKERE